MKLKKLAAAGLSAAMIFTGAAAAFAADAPISNPAGGGQAPAGAESNTALPEGPAYIYHESAKAKIVELNLKSGGKDENGVAQSSWILIRTDGENPREIRLNFSEKTILLDTQTGLPVTAAELKKDQEIFAYYDAAMTKSLPPQAHAQAILVNLHAVQAPAHLLTAEQVTETDGTINLLAENGSVIVKVAGDTPISPLYTKNIVRNTDIHMGTRIFAWYDVAALSMPAQANATKVVILPNEDRDVTIVSEGDIAIGTGRVENGIVMVPLKLTAQKLGFNVTWDGKTETVHLSNGKVQTAVKLGEDSYYAAADSGQIGMSKPSSLGAEAYEVDGVSWAPAELFNMLRSGNTLRLKGNTLYL